MDNNVHEKSIYIIKWSSCCCVCL